MGIEVIYLGDGQRTTEFPTDRRPKRVARAGDPDLVGLLMPDQALHERSAAVTAESAADSMRESRFEETGGEGVEAGRAAHAPLTDQRPQKILTKEGLSS
jgi:hypothetical protein